MPPQEEPTEGTQEQGEEAYVVASPSGRILFRAMREDPAGTPMVGPTARTLGVRPNVADHLAHEISRPIER